MKQHFLSVCGHLTSSGFSEISTEKPAQVCVIPGFTKVPKKENILRRCSVMKAAFMHRQTRQLPLEAACKRLGRYCAARCSDRGGR